MSLLLRLRTAAWLLLLAVAPVWAQQVEQQQDGSVVARTPLYEAVVRVDGYLHSLKVAGTELLDDRVSFSKGIYLHNQTRQVFKMAAPQVNGTTVTASGEVATLTYSFRPDGLDVSVESTTSGNLYGVFSNAVKRLRNQQTGAEVAAPGALTASDVTLLTDGPWLRAVGGNRLWGPWPTAAEPRQV
ncbi:MAG: hypothetical protein HUU35_19705, partial [Armatimonadetes bacterium]|nr:hypothetical protein [Armatimonadota bacterium]